MARTAKKKQSTVLDDLPAKDEITYIIKEASLKDDFCNYQFEITGGVGLGGTHNVKGPGIIKDSLRHSFGKLIVHLAVIDDVFKHSNIEIEDIDNFHTHDLTALYDVTGIKIKGGKDNESVILIGGKYVSAAGGRIDLTTPKIPMDHFSSYKWYNELKVAIDEVRKEAALYNEGNYVSVETEEDETDTRQLKIGEVVETNDDDDFENSRIQ